MCDFCNLHILFKEGVLIYKCYKKSNVDENAYVFYVSYDMELFPWQMWNFKAEKYEKISNFANNVRFWNNESNERLISVGVLITHK